MLPILSLACLSLAYQRTYRGLLATTMSLGSVMIAPLALADAGHHHGPPAQSYLTADVVTN